MNDTKPAAPAPDAEAFANQHVETFVEQYNDVYCDQRKAGVGGGDAERAAMRQVLILALGAFHSSAPVPVNKEHKMDLKKIVDRFLSWPLPKSFSPDCGISFDGRKDDEWNKNKTWPIGTNLFTAEEARQMFEYALAAAPAPDDARDAARYRFLKTMGGQVLFIDIARNKGADFLDAAVDKEMQKQV